MTKTQYGLIILKPDAIMDGLENEILKEIEAANLALIFSKKFHFKLRHIPFLCDFKRTEGSEKKFLGFIKNYGSGDSLILVVKTQRQDAIEEILELKGKIDSDGLRKKYFPFSYEHMLEIEETDPETFGYMKARNRLHSPDTLEELKKLVKSTFTEQELLLLAHQNVYWSQEILEEMKHEVKVKIN